MNKIVNYKQYSKEDLFNIIRNTSIKGDSSVFPFSDFKLSVQTISQEDLIPTQTFVFNDQIKLIQNLVRQFSKLGIDLFSLNGFVSFKTLATQQGGQNEIRKIAEEFVYSIPIVEVIEGAPLIIDGMHRATVAGKKKIPFNALFIENVPEHLYPYQLPLSGGWSAVKQFKNKLPDGFSRKERRYPDGFHKYYFCDYPFPGIIKLAREHTGK
ncbi:MAG: hypothetical protein LBF37_03665 [Rickettsiales bacterium]|jgi:hypothetical protein|nr:hypothetical protein [Rickettsiales bacterium]